ncbi:MULTISPECIES: hypothetical protein [Staphylococcus]|uniref:hypothetical protein n=1 Tax=Staphylococcus TaxID=1279 RepID=UPI00194FA132|nr:MULTISPECIES: hypothetical protein [Staphylococcus]MEB6290486.1 hypothetical protein [Staphylococcus xylosus]
MKKVFASLGVILLVAVFGVSVVFAYGSYKDLELKKEEAKVTENKQKDSKNKTSKNEQQNQTINQKEIQEPTNTNNNQAYNINEESNTDEVRTTEDSEEIKKTENGIDYTGEFDSLEEKEKFEKDVMSQSGGGPSEKEEIDKNWDSEAEYAKQQEVYNKAARGEIPEPGETVK